MRLIEKTGLKSITSKTGNVRKRQFGLFECPKCFNKVERTIQNGEKSLSCGSQRCKDTHPAAGSAAKREPVYTAWIYMKQVCRAKGEGYPDEWLNYEVFLNQIGKQHTVGSRFTRYDPAKNYSVENCYWKKPSKFVEGRSCTNQNTTLSGRKFEQHGMHDTRPYRIWRNMKTRCYDANHKSYSNYGGRGITVCPQWRDSFHTFWLNMQEGYTDEMTIDRKDSTLSYYPENCRWITLAENSGRSRAKETKQIDRETGDMIKIWPNARQAGLELGIDPSSIAKVCKGKKKSAGGFVWMN